MLSESRLAGTFLVKSVTFSRQYSWLCQINDLPYCQTAYPRRGSMNRWMLISLCLVFTSVVPFSRAGAVNECADCVERKRQMCAQECLLVGPSHSIQCQLDCVRHYCGHRCKADDPALLSVTNPDCTECLDRQFNLCDPDCPTGTDRIRALCKLDCSSKKCSINCPTSPTVKNKPAVKWVVDNPPRKQ